MNKDNFDLLLSRELRDLPDGTEVIREEYHWDVRGYPAEHKYHRCVLGTLDNMFNSRILWAEPNVEFCEIPQWGDHWIYAQNDPACQLWIRKGARDGESKDTM